jgi:type IV pilus assembly protein PilQ
VRPIFDHCVRYGIDREYGGVYVEGPHDAPPTLTEKQFWQQAELLVGMLDAYLLFGDEKYWAAFRNVYDFVFGKFVNLPAGGIGGFNPGQFALTLFNSSLTRLINLELTALEADGRGKVISSPRVVTADKVKATIEQGTEIPYQQATSSGATSVAFRKAVLKLEVTPQITPEGGIFLDVRVNKDTRGQETISGPAIDTKNVQTQVLVENGGTVVLGGIYEQQDRTTVTKVPLLGDLPVVGYLFKNTSQVNDRTELIIFITPRVISEKINAAMK